MNLVSVDQFYPDNFSGFRLGVYKNVPVANTGDVTVPGGASAGLGIPASQYTVRKVRVSKPRDVNGNTLNASALVASLWTGAAGTGTQLVNAFTFAGLTALLTYNEATLTAAANTTIITSGTLFFNVGTGVAGAFVDIEIYGDILPGNL